MSTSIIMAILLQILIGGTLQFLWGLLNMTQVVTFSPLMGLSPPDFVMEFFKSLNFVNMEIFIEKQSIINKIRYIQTFKSWNKKFSMFNLVMRLFGGKTYLIFVILASICVIVVLLVYVVKSTRVKSWVKSLLG